MLTLIYFLFLLAISPIALCQEKCLQKYQNMNSKEINLNEYCNDPSKPCIIKCCGGNDQIFYNFTDDDYGLACDSKELYKTDTQNTTLTVYKNNIKSNIEKISRNISDFKLLLDMDIDCKDMITEYKLNTYLLENGVLMLENPNRYKRWFEFRQYSFCFDYVIDIRNETAINEPYIWFGVFKTQLPKMNQRSATPNENEMLYATVGFLTSSFFLVLVLLVYAILPDLHTIGGLLLMASVATQICAFLITAIQYIKYLQGSAPTEFCEKIRYPKYFFLLSTIFWVTAQSFEAWTIITHKKFTIFRNDKRKEKILKIFLYALFAWGTPAIMTIGLKVVHEMDLSDKPWFIKPHLDASCYFGDFYSLLLYQDVPILILLGFNMILYIFSVRQLLRQNKWKSNNNTENKTKFWFYLKLSLVMGLTWLVYVAVGYLPPEWYWFAYICYTYTLFSGVAIFFFFVVRKKVLRLLKKKVLHHCLSSKEKSLQRTEYGANDTACNELTTINDTN